MSNYCQYPLCSHILPYEGPRLGEVIRHHSAVRTGLFWKHKWGKDLGDEPRFPDWRDRLDPFVDLTDEHQEALAIYVAHADPKSRIDSADQAVEDYLAVEIWQEEFETAFGREPYVRIRADLVDDMRRGIISEREFRVLSAILSAVGKKKRAVVSYDRIRYAAAGFRSQKVWNEWAKRPLRNPTPSLLSTSQVRRVREKLEPRGIFHSLNDGRRRHYGVRVGSHDELRQLIQKARKPRIDRLTAQKKAEALLRAQIRSCPKP